MDFNISNKHGNVQIYDLREKEFTMLVRSSEKFSPNIRHERDCYSVISNENTDVKSDEKKYFVYGYNSFSINCISHVLERDSYSMNTNNESPSQFVNRIMTPREIVNNHFGYSEINIVNEKDADGKFISKKPDYIVAFNQIEERHLIEAVRLNIPIVIVNSRKLDKDNVTNVPFDFRYDKYIESSRGEEEIISTR